MLMSLEGDCIREKFSPTLGGYVKAKFLILPFGGLHMKHAVQRGILGTNSAFALGQRKTTENLDRVGRSQDLPEAFYFN
jgi:hypothetical protein